MQQSGSQIAEEVEELKARGPRRRSSSNAIDCGCGCSLSTNWLSDRSHPSEGPPPGFGSPQARMVLCGAKRTFAEQALSTWHLSEYDFQRAWKQLFNATCVTAETLQKARQLVDELPRESPLRVRFDKELDEIEALANQAE